MESRMRIDPENWLLNAHRAQNEAVRALQQAPPDFRRYDSKLALADSYKRLIVLAFVRGIEGAPRQHPMRHALWIFGTGCFCAGFWALIIFALYECSRVLAG
jgi:hypothetical protein